MCGDLTSTTKKPTKKPTTPTTTTTEEPPIIMREVIIRLPCGGKLPCEGLEIKTIKPDVTKKPDDCVEITKKPDDCDFHVVDNSESESCEDHDDSDHHYKIQHNAHHPRNDIWNYSDYSEEI